MGKAVPEQHPAVVLRSHYVHLRALLVAALIAVLGLTATVVIVANDSDQAAVTSKPAPATIEPGAQSAPLPQRKLDGAVDNMQVPRYDGRERYLDVRDRALVAFESVAAAAERHGVRALIETHMQTILPSASAAAAFCARFPAEQVGVIHDAGNMVFEGYEQYRLGLELLGPHLAHVHVKSARWAPTRTSSRPSTRPTPARCSARMRCSRSSRA